MAPVLIEEMVHMENNARKSDLFWKVLSVVLLVVLAGMVGVIVWQNREHQVYIEGGQVKSNLAALNPGVAPRDGNIYWVEGRPPCPVRGGATGQAALTGGGRSVLAIAVGPCPARDAGTGQPQCTRESPAFQPEITRAWPLRGRRSPPGPIPARTAGHRQGRDRPPAPR